MMDSLGYVAECTGDNVFIIKDNILSTPSQGHLKGITRKVVMQLAKKLKLEVQERLITRHEIFNADECFLTGTAAEAIPVVKVDGRIIGDGRPGPITKRLIEEFRKIVTTDGVRID